MPEGITKDIIIKGITKTFGDHTRAHDNINFIIPSGKIFGVLGPNGAGKSTLLRIIGNLLEPDSGTISYGDKEISRNKKWAKKNMSYCPQKYVVYDFLTVVENLELISELYDIPKADYKKRISFLLKNLEMKIKRNSRVKNLSGGQKKKLSIMMSLLISPAVILLDEPTTGLDAASIQTLNEYILNLKKQSLTVIISTHSFIETLEICDDIAILQEGKLIYSGNLSQISTNSPTTDKNSFKSAYLSLIKSNSTTNFNNSEEKKNHE